MHENCRVGWVACLTIPSLMHGGQIGEESKAEEPDATPLLSLTVCSTGVFVSCIHTLRRVRSGEPTSSRLPAIDAIRGLAVGVASTVAYPDAAFERFDRMKHVFIAGRFREGQGDEKQSNVL